MVINVNDEERMFIPPSWMNDYSPDCDYLCLDFINTVSWRAGVERGDILTTYPRLVSWAEMLEAIDATEADALISAARQQPDRADAILDRATALREALYRIFSAMVKGAAPAEADLARLNQEARSASQMRALVYTPQGVRLTWEAGEANLERVLWPVAQDAIDLLISDDLLRLGECENEECGWLFIDATKNKSRRWCSMEVCGNRAKARRHYQRKKSTATPA